MTFSSCTQSNVKINRFAFLQRNRNTTQARIKKSWKVYPRLSITFKPNNKLQFWRRKKNLPLWFFFCWIKNKREKNRKGKQFQKWPFRVGAQMWFEIKLGYDVRYKKKCQVGENPDGHLNIPGHWPSNCAVIAN